MYNLAKFIPVIIVKTLFHSLENACVFLIGIYKQTIILSTTYAIDDQVSI